MNSDSPQLESTLRLKAATGERRGDGYFLESEIDQLESELFSNHPAQERGDTEYITKAEFLHAISQIIEAIREIRIHSEVHVEPEIVARIVEHREIKRVQRDGSGKIESIETKIIDAEQ